MNLDDLESLNSLKQSKSLKKRQSKEDSIQAKTVKYLKDNYADVIYSFDASGIRASIGTIMKMKRQGIINRSHPDLKIHLPKGKYHSLLIELKKDGVKIFKEDGTAYKSEHHEEQIVMLRKLRDLGFACSFGIGYDHICLLIDSYINEKFDVFEKNIIL